MLYVIEESWEDDYHLMPFRLICEHISLSDFEKAMEVYMKIRPSIILVHVLAETRKVTEFIKNIRRLNSKCTIIVLTSEALQDELNDILGDDIQKLLAHPITFEELVVTMENVIDYDNLYYYITKTLLFEPNKSSLVLEEKHIKLTPKETKLLSLLLQNRDRIVSYAEIENYVWKDKSMSRNTLTSIVGNIRKKSGLAEIIKNYSDQGYQIGEL